MRAENRYELHYLSSKFYETYSSEQYPEMARKPNRPYIVLLIKIEKNTFALPLRTNIRHNSCYKFEYSSRPTESSSGIDFSKAVVVNKAEYIGEFAEMDNKEYVELNDRIGTIITRFKAYVRGYHLYVAGKTNSYISKQYRYTTLKYFHKELGIE